MLTLYSMGDSWKHAEWKKSATEGHRLYKTTQEGESIKMILGPCGTGEGWLPWLWGFRVYDAMLWNWCLHNLMKLLQNNPRHERVGPLARSLPAFVVVTFVDDNRWTFSSFLIDLVIYLDGYIQKGFLPWVYWWGDLHILEVWGGCNSEVSSTWWLW